MRPQPATGIPNTADTPAGPHDHHVSPTGLDSAAARALRELAIHQRQTTKTRAHDGIILCLRDLERNFQNLYKQIGARTVAGVSGTRAEEWLLDNRYAIQDALQQVRENLPASYLRLLPVVSAEDGQPVLRAQRLAIELLRIGAKPVDLEWAAQAVNWYQEQTTLTIGELWALPSLLRLVILIELADDACACVSGTLPQSSPPRADEKNTNADPERHTAEVASAIISLRHIETHDWRCFFERLSRVENALRRDPAGAYGLMDFESRDQYRRAIEDASRSSDIPELTIAEKVVQSCARHDPTDIRMRHVGCLLTREGRESLERKLGCRVSLWRRTFRWCMRRPAILYFTLLAGFTLPPLMVLSSLLPWRGLPLTGTVVLLVLAAIPIIGLAVAMLNGLVVWLLPPRRLHKLDFEKGIPAEFRTAVVVPVLFAGTEDVDHVLERIEINRLNNEDDNLVYVVLSDFADADTRITKTDPALLRYAIDGINALNQRHRDADTHHGSQYLLLHRERRWNDAEGCWMGWERKRGKLAEFNRLLAGDSSTGFSTCIGPREAFDGIRFVITLDADTHMPPGAARRMVGALAHPLNNAALDSQRRTLASGYSILQPRLDIDPDSSGTTRFSAIFTGDTTLDLYTHAVSDVYFDLFGEGIYAGKGIYDWKAFEYSLHSRVPENALLSHDLLEGVHGRVALSTDIVLLEQYPPNVLAYLRRQHRWVRGDWQLLPWLRPLVPSTKGGWQLNPLSLIHRWKIIDNLRRSLQPPAVLALVLIAWSGLLSGPAWAWTLIFAGMLAAPLISEVFNQVGRGLTKPRTLPARLREGPVVLRQRLEHWLLTLVLLPFESALLLDAILRTLFRVLVSHRLLLEWTSAAHTNRRLGGTPGMVQTWREMWISPAFAATVLIGVLALNPEGLAQAAPLLLAWLLAPQIAWWVNQPLHPPHAKLKPHDIQVLRNLARRTWLFFHRYLGPDDHWLPPDNYQEEPRAVLARRTSPTNIGMALLSTLSAHDLGYLDLDTLAARLRNSLERMDHLEQYRGHLLNWYETRDLRPLQPRYVSTVDSGNLAASLVALARGLEVLQHVPITGAAQIKGIADTLDVLEETLQAPARTFRFRKPLARFRQAVRRLRQSLDTSQESWWQQVERLHEREVPALYNLLLGLLEADDVGLSAEALGQLRTWVDELQRQVHTARRMVENLHAWQHLLANPPALYLNPLVDHDLPSLLQHLRETLNDDVTLAELAQRCAVARSLVTEMEPHLDTRDTADDLLELAQAWNRQLLSALSTASDHALKLLAELQGLAALADRWVARMDFRFLYDESRHLFRLGFNVTTGVHDSNYYDLLASEARLTGFLAIAKGDVPAKHWLHLARPFRRFRGSAVLMSWGATLFEYLMPRLLMATPDGSLLARASQLAIAAHREFSRNFRLPWGISESGYYHLDDHQHYQYRAFGVPGIGYRRNLGDRVVIAPYACILSLPFDPAAVLENLQHLKTLNMIGQYGLYEAVDFGRPEKAALSRARIVSSYMSHHQGMALVAINNFLHDDVMVRRFHADRRVTGISLLLHELLPRNPPALVDWERPHPAQKFQVAAKLQTWPAPLRSPAQQYNALSNGHYTLLLSADGGGGSRWEDLALTRWQTDATCDEWGQWFYVKDLDDDSQFSLGMHPLGGNPAHCSVRFGPHLVEYQRRERELLCQMHVALSSQHDVEARKILIRNESGRPRRLLLASCVELALASPQDDLRHPAFSKLFVESRYLDDESLLLFRRRPRSSEEKPVYLGHTVLVNPSTDPRFSWETDRVRFLGRNGRAAQPAALALGLDGFSGTTGTVLDPVLATGIELTLEPHKEVEVVYLTCVDRTRHELISTLRSYRSMPRVDWIFEQARMQSEQELHLLQIDPGEVHGMARLLSATLSPRRQQRATPEALAGSQAIQSTLWARGISGDNPIVLAQIRAAQDSGFAEQLIKAHSYWCGRQLPMDLVLIDEESGGYAQPARDQLLRLVSDIRARSHRKQVGSVFVLPGKEVPEDERIRLFAAAYVLFDSARGSMHDQLAHLQRTPLPPFVPSPSGSWKMESTPGLARPTDLQFDNGLGGFSADGHEYVIHLAPGQHTPAPWSNVIANPEFGCLVSESGGSCTWAGNSGEHRLTPWYNDPLRDTSGEAIYLRDEETAEVWSPTPQPMPADAAYQVRHGAGYSEFLHHSHGLRQQYRVWVDSDSPVKLCRLTLTNLWKRPRRITVTYYAEWVMGVARSTNAPHIVCEFDPQTSTLLARNTFARNAGHGMGFLGASQRPHGLTADRGEFLGQSGSLQAPDALLRIGLSGAVHPGDDPCAAYQLHIDLPADATQSVHFILGYGRDRAEAITLAKRFHEPSEVEASVARVQRHWDEILGAVQVETPEPATNLMLNRWLLYQALACRLWGRTGYYQSSGAFGFRDQLQDVMALTWTAPELTRAQILRAANCQFREGDVLHWWHEHPLRGVRTRCSDDLLWLPFVVAHYIRCTDDLSILRERVPYLVGPVLERDEAERYTEFAHSDEQGSLYEHCCRAIERAVTVGPHGLPTIGSGDWNDGMNRISTTGRGESVWLGWFLLRVCRDFAPLCERMGDTANAQSYRNLGDDMHLQIESQAWDGQWYLRAWYDDGTPLGSAENDECQIDSLAQTWSVLGPAQPSARARQAMQSLYKHLVRVPDRLVLLLTPPFDRTGKDPGYIKGYPPGIRENGGQYSHAATWVVWAAAGCGDGERAMQMFRLLNPILRSDTPEAAARYRVEPYVMAGDIYSVAPHSGRGGWSWYTGAAGWLYRAGIEALLGVRQHGRELEISPCLPASWPQCRVHLRNGRSRYHITIHNPQALARGALSLRFDGQAMAGKRVPFVDDGAEHQVEAWILADSAAPVAATATTD